MESTGADPEQTLRLALLRVTAGSSLAAGRGAPRFSRRGDGAFGPWAALTSEQQREIVKVAAKEPRMKASAFAEVLARRVASAA